MSTDIWFIGWYALHTLFIIGLFGDIHYIPCLWLVYSVICTTCLVYDWFIQWHALHTLFIIGLFGGMHYIPCLWLVYLVTCNTYLVYNWFIWWYALHILFMIGLFGDMHYIPCLWLVYLVLSHKQSPHHIQLDQCLQWEKADIYLSKPGCKLGKCSKELSSPNQN